MGHRSNRLRARADADLPDHFRTDSIELHPPGASHLLAFSEAGHAFGPAYVRGDLPSEARLQGRTSRRRCASTGLLAARGDTDDLEVEDEESDSGGTEDTLEEYRRYRYHRSLERSAALAREAKRVPGFTCQGCGFNFEEAYGELVASTSRRTAWCPWPRWTATDPFPDRPSTISACSARTATG